MNQDAAIHVVDDDPGVRESTRMLFESLGYAVRTYPSADDFLDAYSPQMRGCVLLDLHMPGTAGLEMQARLAQLDAGLPIVFLTAHGDVPAALRALKQGAVSFLLKPVREQDLIDAVNHALRREREGRGRHEAATALRARLAELTAREHDVIEHVLAGHATKITANALGISERTVEAHRARAFTKLHVRSVPELVRALEALS